MYKSLKKKNKTYAEDRHFTFIRERSAKMATGWVFFLETDQKQDTQVQEARVQMETDGTDLIRKWNG